MAAASLGPWPLRITLALLGSVASSGFAGLPALMYVGCASAAGANAFNGSMDDLGILAYAADPNLLRTIYESDAPILPKRAATCSAPRRRG